MNASGWPKAQAHHPANRVNSLFIDFRDQLAFIERWKAIPNAAATAIPAAPSRILSRVSSSEIAPSTARDAF